MNKKQKEIVKEILSTVIYLALVVLVTWLLITFVAQRTLVDGASMEPTLQSGNNLIVEKISYRFSDPERFDVVVFPVKYDPKTYYIKRVIGLPGETVQIMDNGDIYINGELLNEGYGKEVINYSGRAADPITLGADEFFVLGDNRNNSTDSRDPLVGNIRKSELTGKAWVRIWPLSKFGILKHQ